MDPTIPTTPAVEPDDNLNMSGMTDDLQNFMQTWCDDSVNPDDTARMLHSPEGAQYAGWLENQLRDAYLRGVFTPGFMAVACNHDFPDQQAITDWILSIWPSWFDKPFSGGAPAPQPTQTQAGYQYQQPGQQQVVQPQYQQPVQQIAQPQYQQPGGQVVQPQYQQPQPEDPQLPPQQPGQPGAPQGY